VVTLCGVVGRRGGYQKFPQPPCIAVEIRRWEVFGGFIIDVDFRNCMPTNLPVAASGSREPDRRPKPIPRAVRTVCLLMIYGNVDGQSDDPDAAPIDFVTAARIAGIQPHVMRRWLHRPQVIGLIRRERAAFRQALCCGNELALKRVRDRSKNPMGVVASVRALEQMPDDLHSRSAAESPHMTIQIVNVAAPTPAPVTLDHEPQPDPRPLDPYKPQVEYDAEGHRIPVFDPYRDR
jgi:hypothetical protein